MSTFCDAIVGLDGADRRLVGLAICKTTASRHGWRLSAVSTPTVGSTFEIVFPGARQTP